MASGPIWYFIAILLANIYKILYIYPMDNKQEIDFRGDSLDALRAFPVSARKEAGFQLDKVQSGEDPDNWKPMNTIGSGVREIRIQDAAGIFRVIYIAKLADAVYVLHCFQKKTAKTSDMDKDLATKRYKELM
jgi:phage-related protein